MRLWKLDQSLWCSAWSVFAFALTRWYENDSDLYRILCQLHSYSAGSSANTSEGVPPRFIGVMYDHKLSNEAARIALILGRLCEALVAIRRIDGKTSTFVPCQALFVMSHVPSVPRLQSLMPRYARTVFEVTPGKESENDILWGDSFSALTICSSLIHQPFSLPLFRPFLWPLVSPLSSPCEFGHFHDSRIEHSAYANDSPATREWRYHPAGWSYSSTACTSRWTRREDIAAINATRKVAWYADYAVPGHTRKFGASWNGNWGEIKFRFLTTTAIDSTCHTFATSHLVHTAYRSTATLQVNRPQKCTVREVPSTKVTTLFRYCL